MFTIDKATKIQLGLSISMVAAGIALTWQISHEIGMTREAINLSISESKKLRESVVYWIDLLDRLNTGKMTVPAFPK